MNTAMINTQLLLTFAMTVAVVVVVPGPSVMFIVGRALCVGRPGAIAAAAGTTLGAVVQGLLVVFGVGTVIAESALFYNVIKFGGALYLVMMGAQTLRHRELATETDEAPTSAGRRRVARQGFLVGATNPKLMVFFSAALPQFVDRSRGHVVVQMLVLLAVFSVMSLISDTSWGFAGGSIRTWSANAPRRIERLIGAGGICIIVVGLALARSNSVG